MAGLFSNPMFDALALGEVGSNLAQSNLAAQQAALRPDLTSQQFATYAALHGELADKLPRAPGLFSNIGQKLGLLSPTVAPRGKDIAAELDVISKQREEKLADIGKEVGLREKLGPENWAGIAGTPAMRDITQAATGKGLFGIGGTPELAFGAPTPGEAKTAALERYRQSQETVAQERIGIALEQLDLQKKREARMDAVPKLGTPEYEAAVARATAARTTAGEKAKSDLYNNNWDQFDRVNKGQLQYYDKKALTPVDKRLVKTPADAANDPVHYKQVNMKGADTLNKIRDEINRSNNIINDVAVMFPDTRGMTKGQKAYAVTKWGLANRTVDRYNKDVIDFQQLKADVMQYIRELQQRYPTAIEMRQIGEGSFPDIMRDGREDAIQKMRNIITSLRTAADVATDKENEAISDSAAKADYNSDVYGYSEPATPPPAEPASPNVVPEGMPPPPAGLSTDETPSDVMGGGTP